MRPGSAGRQSILSWEVIGVFTPIDILLTEMEKRQIGGDKTKGYSNNNHSAKMFICLQHLYAMGLILRL